jgi:hypothetical protein
MLYHVTEQLLIPEENPVGEASEKHSSGSSWSLALPPKKGDARYFAFRIAGAPGSEREQDGSRIALTLLDKHD